MTTVHSLVEGGAAERGGLLKPKDKIIAVAQGVKGKKVEELRFEDVVGWELTDVVKKIKGPRGTSVFLKILRKKKGKSERRVIKIVRDKINLKSQRATIDYTKRFLKGKQRNIGIIRFPSFYGDGKKVSVSSDIKKLLKEAKKKSIDGLILDLSSNGGGLLNEAVKVSGLFLKKGNIVKETQRNSDDIIFSDNSKSVYYGGPLVVLVNKASASSSEIVAGALKDYSRAVIVGGKATYGKGTVQSVNIVPSPSPLKRGNILGAVKTTVGFFFVPKGYSTQYIGVTSDIVLPNALDFLDELSERSLPNALSPEKGTPFLSNSVYDSSWRKISQKLKMFLQKKSKKRVSKNKEFKKIIAEGKKSQKKNKKLISVKEILEVAKERSKNKREEENKKLTEKQKKLEKKKKYLERVDLVEAVNVVVDMINYYESPHLSKAR